MLICEHGELRARLREFERAFRGIHRNYWYALRTAVLIVVSFFRCERCGACCRYSPPVFREEEAVRIARYLGRRVEDLPLEPFISLSRRYFRAGSPCPFLGEDNKCTVYEVRGAQCRSFPHEWLMYSMVPAYCPALPKAIAAATKYIVENAEKVSRAATLMEYELSRLARDSGYKERMRYLEYRPLVNKLLRILEES